MGAERSRSVVVWWMVRRCVVAFAVLLALVCLYVLVASLLGTDFADVGGPVGVAGGVLLFTLMATPVVLVLGAAAGLVEWLVLRQWPGSSLPAVAISGVTCAALFLLVAEWWEPSTSLEPVSAVALGSAVALLVGTATFVDARRLARWAPAPAAG